jgi:hypothetical protein
MHLMGLGRGERNEKGCGRGGRRDAPNGAGKGEREVCGGKRDVGEKGGVMGLGRGEERDVGKERGGVWWGWEGEGGVLVGEKGGEEGCLIGLGRWEEEKEGGRREWNGKEGREGGTKFLLPYA